MKSTSRIAQTALVLFFMGMVRIAKVATSCSTTCSTCAFLTRSQDLRKKRAKKHAKTLGV